MCIRDRHIVLHCPHWNKERREACLPSHAAVAPACVRLHGLLPAPGPGLLPAHEPALVPKAGVTSDSPLCGPTDRESTAATHTSDGVGLDMSLTQANGAG
eukprot:5753197-Amphidinium_carterae.1